MAGPGGMDVGQLLADQLMQAAKVVEEQLDAELNKLEHMDEDEMEALVIILIRLRGLDQKNSVSIELDVFKTSILFVWLG
jgi:hypothetical protein